MGPEQPILVFDTGVGGLSILAPVRRLLPQAPIAYAMDREGFPYGLKPPSELSARIPALLGRLAEHVDPRIIVIACNTASVIALDPVRAALHLPIVGTVPAIKPAAEISQTRVIGVLGTESTVRQPYVDNLSREFARDCTVIRHGSARLVELAERHVAGDTPPAEEFRAVMDQLFDQPGAAAIDTVVLACTHFPLVEDQLAAAAPHPVTFVHGGDGIARRTAHLTRGQPWPDAAPPPTAILIGAGTGDEALFEGMRGYGFERFEML